MQKTNTISLKVIASCLLVLYVSACGTGICICPSDMERSFEKTRSYSGHHTETHSTDSHTHAAASAHHDDSDGNHPHDTGGDCCVDMLETLIAKDLVLKAASSFSSKTFNILLPVYILFHLSIQDANLVPDISIHRYKYPPPKVPDIRIFIQSFLN